MMAKLWKALLTSIKREKFLALTNYFVMTLTFLILGLFVSVVFVTQSALQYLENQAQVTVFFKDDFPEENILKMREELIKDERILDVTYVSKEEAFKIFMEMNKDDPVLLDSISANVLPASLEIKAKKLVHLNEFALELEGIDGVEEVKFFKDVIERFRFVSRVVYTVGFGLTVLFLAISYAVIMATIRMAINAKGSELEIQKLVGASDAYVKKPLIFQGVVFGLVSALTASVLIVLLSVGLSFTNLFGYGLLVPLVGVRANVIVLSTILGVVLLVSGGFLGYFGSSITVKKYLKY